MKHTKIICAGSVLWDVIGRTGTKMAYGADQAGKIERRPGGVALNIAAALAKQGESCSLLSVLGEDASGRELQNWASDKGIDAQNMVVCAGSTTDSYMAIEDPNGVVAALADAALLEQKGAQAFDPLTRGMMTDRQSFDGLLILDGNFTQAQLHDIILHPITSQSDICLVPASPGKMPRLRPLLQLRRVGFYLNSSEACQLADLSPGTAREAVAQHLLSLGARRVTITDGPNPVLDQIEGQAPIVEQVPSVQARQVTGAGDCFVAAHIAAQRRGYTQLKALQFAIKAASLHISQEKQPDDPSPTL